MTLRIDAHQHFWRVDAPRHEWPQADLPAICRDFLPHDLAAELQNCGLHGTVLVQSQGNDADTDWMLALAADTPTVLGVVGWVDIIAPDAPACIAQLARHPKLKGLRPMLQDLPPGWIGQAAARPGLEAMIAHGLVLDALIRPAHLVAIAALADRYPALPIVVDHGAKPDIAGDIRQPWAADLASLALRPNVSCKLSGLVTEASNSWSAADLRPFVEHILAVFGAGRVLWGSDWPVLLLRGAYPRWHATAQAMVAEDARAAVFGGNAARIYNLAASDRPRGRTTEIGNN